MPNTFAAMYLRRVDPSLFAIAYDIARASSDQIRDMTSPFEDDGHTEFYLTDDKRSGFALRTFSDLDSTELIYVFSTERGRGDFLVRAAVDRSRMGCTLDCFDGYLPSLYARHGFVETDREPNWTPGGPDVVFMEYDPA